MTPEEKLVTNTQCNHLVSRKSGDIFISFFANVRECPHCLGRKVIVLEDRITQLEILLRQARAKLDAPLTDGILTGPDRILATKIDEIFGQVRYG